MIFTLPAPLSRAQPWPMQRALWSLLACLLVSSPVLAQPLDTVNVLDTPKGYEIEISHDKPMSYESHSPQKSGKLLTIQLRQRIATDKTATDKDEALLAWDSAFGVPLAELRMTQLTSSQPKLVLRFTREVKFSVKNSRDNRTTVIHVETDRPAFKGPEPKRTEKADNLVTALKGLDSAMDETLDRVNTAMLDKDYRRAVPLLQRIYEQGNNAIKPPAKELIGLNREYLNQNTQAIAEYQEYLALYPESDSAPRVRQRLNALLTAAQNPTDARSKAEGTNGAPDRFKTLAQGTLSQSYLYDAYTTPSLGERVGRSALNNQLDLQGRASNAHYDLRAQLSGTYQKDFEYDGDEDVVNPTRLFGEARFKDWGLFTRLGRQTRGSGGVMGRFDGVHLAYEALPSVTVNTVLGYPVHYLLRDSVNVDQQFYGASVDVGTLFGGWDFSGFYIRQDYLDVKDREAIGGEVRYFDASKSLFGTLDYDVFFDQLNIVTLHSRYAFTDKTAMTAGYDYRANPILISTGALQIQTGQHTVTNGQYAEYFEQLFTRFTLDEIYELVASTLYDYQTASLGLNHKLSDRWVIDFDWFASRYSGTRGSLLPGLPEQPAIEGTDWDFYYSATTTRQAFLHPRDSIIFNLRFTDSSRATGTTAQAYWRIGRIKHWQFSPKLRFDYRVNTQTDDTRLTLSPSLSTRYTLGKSLQLFVDTGYNQYTDEIGPITYDASGYFVAAGYSYSF
jgi:hypothetical protein